MRITYDAVRDKKRRKELFRYWLSDPFVGALNFLGFYLLRCLPTRAVSEIGGALAPIMVRSRFPKVMQRTKASLDRLRPDLNPEERDFLLKTRWKNIGRVYAEFSILNRIWREGRVKITNEEYILQTLAQKPPAIFVFPHMGNWELLGKYCAEKNLSILIMIKPDRNRFEQKIAAKGRKAIGLNTKREGANTILADTQAMRKVCAHLAQGGHLVIAMDGIQHNQVLVPKFGRNLPPITTNTAFAVRLARHYDAVIIPLWCERLPQTQFTLRVSEPLTIIDDADAERALEDLDKRLEGWILDKPEQWFYLHALRF